MTPPLDTRRLREIRETVKKLDEYWLGNVTVSSALYQHDVKFLIDALALAEQRLEKATVALEDIKKGYGRIGHRDVGEWQREQMIECASDVLRDICGDAEGGK